MWADRARKPQTPDDERGVSRRKTVPACQGCVLTLEVGNSPKCRRMSRSFKETKWQEYLAFLAASTAITSEARAGYAMPEFAGALSDSSV
jgi:hypothetical protein